jgi:hypothetical protein
MAQTTFSGPIRAGTISNTTGTTIGTNVANVGQVVMSQSIMIDAAVAAGTTTYNVGVIPKNSQLLTTTIRVAIASDQGTTATVSVGKTGTAAYVTLQDGNSVTQFQVDVPAGDVFSYNLAEDGILFEGGMTISAISDATATIILDK